MTISKKPQRKTADAFIAGAPDSAVEQTKPKGVVKGKKQQISLTIAPALLEKVDELAAEMQAAIDGLQPVSEGSVTTPDAADTAAAAQTGMMLVLLAAAGMAATAVYRRKRS